MQKKIILFGITGLAALLAPTFLPSLQFPQSQCVFVEAYTKPKDISNELWSAIGPYLLPADHPAKPALDKIFSNSRATASSKSFRDAGFQILEDKEQDLIVAKHPAFPGYLVKVYYDNYKLRDKSPLPGEAQYWVNRIIGVQRVRDSINRHGLGDLFVVPNKWIYPLPDKPEPPGNGFSNIHPKHFILVSEEIDLVSNQDNIRLYKEAMTPQKLDGLYTIMKEAHLYDSIYIDNNIFTKDGKIAFIDTEDFDRKPINFNEMTVNFSPEMQRYWLKLLKERGTTIPPRAVTN